MAKEELSQAELESLLGVAPSATEPAPQRSTPPGDAGRADPVDDEHMHALRTLHASIEPPLADSLSAMLRTPVEVKLTGVQRQTFGQFASSLENTACTSVLKAPPLDGHLVLDIAPSILYPMIARLFGGDPEPSTPGCRAPTEIEQRIALRITGLLVDGLGKVWKNVADVELEVDRVESHPRQAEILPPSQDVATVRFELTMGQLRGAVSLCIPQTVIEQISDKLSAGDADRATPEGAERIGQALEQSLVELRVELARAQITAGELIDLDVGDILTTDQKVDEPLVIDVDGQVQLRARPGAHEGQKAIRIER